MILRDILIILLLTGLIVCAIATALSKKLLRMIIVFTTYSIIMSIIWLLIESPDLAITEAAVGAGVTGILFYVTLKRIHRIDRDKTDAADYDGETDYGEEEEE
ncbi:MAG: DUF4040 domain-containing protein [Clostridia bacterium]|nr:DUF4040 domain-containing protein [Clostridia bacterium]